MERWSFMTPWCESLRRNLRGSMRFVAPDIQPDAWRVPRRCLTVSFPLRETVATTAAYLAQIQQIRETLALLAAVEHVEYAAWRFLLGEHCGVQFGAIGEQIFETQIPVRFVVEFDVQAWGSPSVSFDSDLVRMCGVHQREHPSPEYQETLRRIAELDDSLQKDEPGLDIEIPVRIEFAAVSSEEVEVYEKVSLAQRLAQEEWQLYDARGGHKEVELGSLRCTFQLEWMPPVLSDSALMAKLVPGIFWYVNDWHPHVSLCIEQDGNDWHEKKAFGELMALVFHCIELSRVPGRNLSFSDANRFQLESVEITCNTSAEPLFMGSLFSALAGNRAVRNVTIRAGTTAALSTLYWKWMAYALFSRRVQTFSASDR